MNVSSVNLFHVNPIGLTSANSPQFESLLQRFRLALDDTLMASARLPPVEPVFTLLASSPQPISPLTAPQALVEPPPADTEARDVQEASARAAAQADDDRAARIKVATVATVVMASGSAPADPSSSPAGMANGSTVSLLARGFVKFAPGLGQDRPQMQLATGEPEDLQRVDRVAQIALGLGNSGHAPTPDMAGAGHPPQNGFPESAETTGPTPTMTR